MKRKIIGFSEANKKTDMCKCPICKKWYLDFQLIKNLITKKISMVCKECTDKLKTKW